MWWRRPGPPPARAAASPALLAAAAALLLAAAQPARAWRTQGRLEPRSGSELSYAGKFCFDVPQDGAAPASGLLEVEVEGVGDGPGTPLQREQKHFRPLPDFPPAPELVYLAVFTDTENEWVDVRAQWETLECVDFLRRAAAVRAVTPTLPAGKFIASVVVGHSDRPRFLYFTFVLCNRTVPWEHPPFTYTIHAANRQAGFQEEFSVDEMGSVYLQISGAALFSLVLVALSLRMLRVHGAGAFRSANLLIKGLLMSCGLSAAGCLFHSVHLLVYAKNGEGLASFDVLGEFFACCARVILSSLQLAIARGKEPARRCYLCVLIAAIVVVWLLCEVWRHMFLDWSTTLYFYDSWPGLVILLLNALLFAEVCTATNRLFRRPETDNKVMRIYVATFTAAVLYFLALPAICVLAHLLNPWHRKKVVDRTEVLVRLAASVILAACWWPSRLDSRLAARMESQENRQNAVELAEGFGGTAA